MIFLLFFIGCTPTCEQTCSKLSKCGEVLASEDVCVNSCNAQEQLYDGWKDDFEEQQKEEAQEANREESDGENSESSNTEEVTLTESTDSTEDREESPHYAEQFDEWKSCIAKSTCEDISEGECYDPDLYPY